MFIITLTFKTVVYSILIKIFEFFLKRGHADVHTHTCAHTGAETGRGRGRGRISTQHGAPMGLGVTTLRS